MPTKISASNTTSALKMAGQSTAAYALGHVLDIITTYSWTPDLEKETNTLIVRYDLGWGYILTVTAVSIAVMFVILWWAWRRVLAHFPDSHVDYRTFYHCLLFGDEQLTGKGNPRVSFAAMIMGVSFIAAYAFLASKFLTAFWNLLTIALGYALVPITVVLVGKSALAAVFGVFMFFIYPYHLYRKC